MALRVIQDPQGIPLSTSAPKKVNSLSPRLVLRRHLSGSKIVDPTKHDVVPHLGRKPIKRRGSGGQLLRASFILGHDDFWVNVTNEFDSSLGRRRCLTPYASRRVVGQRGGAGGAICEDHFDLALRISRVTRGDVAFCL